MLPAAAQKLTEAASVTLAQQVQFEPIATPLSQTPILTSYVCQGSGMPLLLVHGFDSSLFEFRRLVRALAPHFQVWAVDLLGFGFTDRRVSPSFSPAAIKLHLHSFWQQRIGQPMALVGASMGGAAAIDFALTYPEIVSQLVLLDSAGFTAGPPLSKLMFPPLDSWAAAFLRNPGVRRRICLQAYCDRTLVTPDAELCATLHLQMPGWKEALIGFTKSGGYPFLGDQLPQLQMPTLILWGEQDRILGTKDAPRFEQAIDQSQLIWIPQCGHVPHLEKPELTAEAIVEFMR